MGGILLTATSCSAHFPLRRRYTAVLARGPQAMPSTPAGRAHGRHADRLPQIQKTIPRARNTRTQKITHVPGSEGKAGFGSARSASLSSRWERKLTRTDSFVSPSIPCESAYLPGSVPSLGQSAVRRGSCSRESATAALMLGFDFQLNERFHSQPIAQTTLTHSPPTHGAASTAPEPSTTEREGRFLWIPQEPRRAKVQFDILLPRLSAPQTTATILLQLPR